MLKLEDGREVEITLYPELQEAISLGWESLAFSGNRNIFAKAEMGNHAIFLSTDGDVKITLKEDGRVLHGCKNEVEIKHLVTSGRIHTEVCEIINNNWFSLHYRINRANYDDDVFESTPKSTEEFTVLFESIVKTYFEGEI